MNELIITGHPLHGFSALGEVQKNISLKFSELQKTYVSSKISSSVKNPDITNTLPQVTAISGIIKLIVGASSTVAATQLFTSVSSWYAAKKREYYGEEKSSQAKVDDSTVKSINEEEILEEINLNS